MRSRGGWVVVSPFGMFGSRRRGRGYNQGYDPRFDPRYGRGYGRRNSGSGQGSRSQRALLAVIASYLRCRPGTAGGFDPLDAAAPV